MFSYRCPGCGKQHHGAMPFAEPFPARCLRCQQPFTVTQDMARPLAASQAGVRKDAVTALRGGPGPAAGSTGVAVKAGARMARGEGAAGRGRRPADAPESDQAADRKSSREKDGPDHDKKDGESANKSSRVRRPGVIVGAILGGVVLLGGGYFLMGSGTPAPRPPVVQAPPPAPVVPARPARPEVRQPAPAPQDTKKAPPPLEPKNSEPIPLAAARLSAELAEDIDAANETYDAALVLVSGLFDHLEKPRPAAPARPPVPPVPPAQPAKPGQPAPGEKPPLPPLPQYRVHFLTEGRPLVCELGAAPEGLKEWQSLRRGEPFTVRAIHVKDGLLRECRLEPLTPPADTRYRGRELEVAGVVDAVLVPGGRDAAYPTLRLAGETHGKLTVDCLFRKEDDGEVGKVEVGAPVVIRGTCNGRREQDGVWHVRMDNCAIATGSAPAAGMPRLPARALARAYEDDLRPYALPEWGREENIDGTLTVEGLSEELMANPQVVREKYRHRIVTVSGRLMGRQGQQVVLESKRTDRPLKVRCLFDRHAIKLVNDGPDLVVRGLCGGLEDDGKLRLDNAEAILPAGEARDPRAVTADFLPHLPGRVLTCDVALFPIDGKRRPVVARQEWHQEKGGKTETVTIRTGVPAGRSMLAESPPGAWVKGYRTKATRLPGPAYQHRVSASLIEVGTPVADRAGKQQTAWVPMLKIGARTGDTWSWAFDHSDHTFTVVGFDELRGQPSLTVLETVTTTLDLSQAREIRHVYVKGVGEVERQETLRVSSKEKRILSELRLMEVDDRGVPAEGKPPAAGK